MSVMQVLAPFVAYGVEGGLRYSDPSTIDARLQGVADDLRSQIVTLDQRQTISVQPDGRVGN